MIRVNCSLSISNAPIEWWSKRSKWRIGKTGDGLKARQENTQKDLHALHSNTDVIDSANKSSQKHTNFPPQPSQLTQLGALSDHVENIDRAA